MKMDAKMIKSEYKAVYDKAYEVKDYRLAMDLLDRMLDMERRPVDKKTE